MEVTKGMVLLLMCMLLLHCGLVDCKIHEKNIKSNKLTRGDALKDTIYLSFVETVSGEPHNYSCDSLSVSGTQISVPQQTLPPHLTCHCLIKDTLFVVVEKTGQSKKGYCTSNSCSEPGPHMDSLNVRLKINAESMDITDEMGNTFKYVNPMEKTISIFFYYQEEDIECHLETKSLTTTPLSPEPNCPPARPTQTSDDTTNDHSHNTIILALVCSVLINILIIVLAVFLYHKLSSRKLKKKMPGMVTAAIQLNHAERAPLNANPVILSSPTTPGSGYTPLGRLNPVDIPSGMEITYSGTTEASGDGETYAASYMPCQGRNLGISNYNQLATSNTASMSDISSIVPSTGNSSLANSRTLMLSSSAGNLDRVHHPSSATNLDIHVPPIAEVKDKQASALPPLPRQVERVMRDNSRVSNSYDYIEYDAMPGGEQLDRDMSHKYLQIT